MGLWLNWVLVIVGIVCVIAELAMGAMTGFDLALVGGSMAIGGSPVNSRLALESSASRLRRPNCTRRAGSIGNVKTTGADLES